MPQILYRKPRKTETYQPYAGFAFYPIRAAVQFA
jgi:hypothetical protein